MATAAAAESAAALSAAQQRFDAAKATAEACAARETAAKLAARVEGIDAIEKELAGIAAELGAILLLRRRWPASSSSGPRCSASTRSCRRTLPPSSSLRPPS